MNIAVVDDEKPIGEKKFKGKERKSGTGRKIKGEERRTALKNIGNIGQCYKRVCRKDGQGRFPRFLSLTGCGMVVSAEEEMLQPNMGENAFRVFKLC